MPFEKGKSGNPAAQFSSNNQPPENGRPKGSRNRSTIVRKLLDMAGVIPTKNYEQLKALFPELDQRMSAEEIGTMMQIARMISKADTQAYKALMDSAYGRPPQAIELSGPDGGPLQVDDITRLTADELRQRISEIESRAAEEATGQH